jgi:hypothetical protein
MAREDERQEGVERIGPIRIDTWRMVSVELSEDQQRAIQEATGERIQELKIALEDVVDLADLIAN